MSSFTYAAKMKAQSNTLGCLDWTGLDRTRDGILSPACCCIVPPLILASYTQVPFYGGSR